MRDSWWPQSHWDRLSTGNFCTPCHYHPTNPTKTFIHRSPTLYNPSNWQSLQITHCQQQTTSIHLAKRWMDDLPITSRCSKETWSHPTARIKSRLHGSPRLINAVESTKANRENSSFQRKWSMGLTGEQVGDGQLSFNVVDSLWVTHHTLPV